MSAREWKNGDAAMLTTVAEGSVRAVRRGGVWMFLDHEGYAIDPYVTDARALVVIDPEDIEHVVRLIDAVTGVGGYEYGPTGGAMQAALREFASPTPKPDEPTGLGAVVEAGCQCDARSHRFVHEPQSDRFENRPGGKEKPWKSTCGHHVWDDLTAVTVLSEGVPA